MQDAGKRAGCRYQKQAELDDGFKMSLFVKLKVDWPKTNRCRKKVFFYAFLSWF